MRTNRWATICLFIWAYSILTLAQTAQVVPALPTLPNFLDKFDAVPLRISRECVANKPFSVVGPRGALLGLQSGVYEAWIFPWKVFRGMRITANMDPYGAPIDINKLSSWIEVMPDHTTITYSHANFTVKQIMLAPKGAAKDPAIMVLYQIQAVRPMTLTFSFEPVMERLWPADSGDHASPEWVPTQGGSGFYAIRNDFADHAAALAIPHAEPGVLSPNQEDEGASPMQFVLHYDPKKDGDTLFPLLMTTAERTADSTNAALAARLAALDRAVESACLANQTYYQNFLSQHTAIETPDARLNAAFSWAEVAIDQLRVRTIDDTQSALTAGFLNSGESARPGFGWFFGRDALWSLYAVHAYGDFETSRSEIEFLIARQRADGKIMHEWSQTAGLVDWKSLPYEYAAADSTPLFLMAVNDYLKITGDTDFVRAHWDALSLAWQFDTAHVSADGIYNNEQGSGWVESWVPAMPHQEIYLAALDQQASRAFSDLAESAGHRDLAEQAKQRAQKIGESIRREYFDPASDFYAFSRNLDGSLDKSATIFPSVAWWDGTYSLDHADNMLSRWASNEFSTDWGTRDLSDRVSFYDPISYHQGTVWPLYTGWASVAEYRTGRALSGYAHLMQNATLTWSQDLGSVTELLSGQFYQAAVRSTAHQLWSSAMVITPVLRGMFGLEWDAANRTLTITPQLPADWGTATLRRLPFANGTLDLTFTRQGTELIVRVTGDAAAKLHLQSRVNGTKIDGTTLRIPLPAVEIAVKQELPEFGAGTRQIKVLDEKTLRRRITLTVSAPASSRQILLLRENTSNLNVQTQDAEIGLPKDGLRAITVRFPAGQGYVNKTVTLSW
jgi:glycogen debranching enzyme